MTAAPFVAELLKDSAFEYARQRSRTTPQNVLLAFEYRPSRAVSSGQVQVADSGPSPDNVNSSEPLDDRDIVEHRLRPVRTLVRACSGATLLSHVCYTCGMSEIASRELRNNTRGLLRRVAGGEDIVITVDGQPVAALRSLNLRPRWISGTDFARRFARRQADPGLRAELRLLAPDMTDDLPL